MDECGYFSISFFLHKLNKLSVIFKNIFLLKTKKEKKKSEMKIKIGFNRVKIEKIKFRKLHENVAVKIKML